MKDRAFQVRIHGREGRGATTAARLLAAAARRQGLPAHVLRSFGREHCGAPVDAVCRIGGDGIPPRQPAVEADALIVQDVYLLRLPDVLCDLAPGGYVLVNARELAPLGLGQLIHELPAGHVLAVPATDHHFPNAAMLGALAAITGVVTLESLTAAIREHLHGDAAERSVIAATDAYSAAVGRGGVVVCGGIHMSDIPSFPCELLWGQRTLRSVANLTRADGEEFLAPAPLVPVRTEVESHPLEDANLALAREGAVHGAAVPVTE